MRPGPTCPGLLPAIGQSGRPPGAAAERLSRRPRSIARRDAVCTALQLTNFWQDLAIDWPRGRLYVPEEIWRRPAPTRLRSMRGRMTPEWAAALRDCGERTRALFAEGRPVCDGVSRPAALRAARHVARRHAHPRSPRAVGLRRLHAPVPTLGTADALVIACGTLLWRATPPSPTRS